MPFWVTSPNRRYKGSIAWSDPGKWPLYKTNGEPQMDINLYVEAPNGQTFTSSTSQGNTSEVVDFCTNQTGNYTLVIRRAANRYDNGFNPPIPPSLIKPGVSFGLADQGDENYCNVHNLPRG